MKSKVKKFWPFTWAPANAGEYIIISFAEQEKSWYINKHGHTKHAPLFPLFVTPWGVESVEFSWKEFVESEDFANTATNTDGSKKYKNVQKFHKVGRVLGTRTEYVNLREIETHSDFTEITSSDGVATMVVFTVVTRIGDPIKAKRLGANFLNTIHATVTESIREVFTTKPFKELLSIGSKDSQGLNIEAIIQKINESTYVKSNDFFVQDVILEIITAGPSSTDVLDKLEEEIKLETDLRNEKKRVAIEEQRLAQKKLQNDGIVDLSQKQLKTLSGEEAAKATQNIVAINKSRNEGLPLNLQTYVEGSNNRDTESIVEKMVPTALGIKMAEKNTIKPEDKNEGGDHDNK